MIGIVRWGNQVQRILDDGRLLLQQTRSQDITSPITVLLEGWITVNPLCISLLSQNLCVRFRVVTWTHEFYAINPTVYK